jgi:hypothetical protein
MKITHANAGRIAAVLYTGGSLLATLTFFTAATIGDYGWVARLGGAGWIFVLAMIILMPTLTPWVRERAGEQVTPDAHH